MATKYDFKITARTAVTIVTLAELKTQCRLPATGTDYDADLTNLYNEAVNEIESSTGRSFENLTCELRLPCLPSSRSTEIRLPSPPLINVTSIAYTADGDVSDFANTIAASDYEFLPGDNPFIKIKGTDWPSGSVDTTRLLPVKITYNAGYASANDVPNVAKQLIRILVHLWFTHRGAAVEKQLSKRPIGYDHLINQLSAGDEFARYGVF